LADKEPATVTALPVGGVFDDVVVELKTADKVERHIGERPPTIHVMPGWFGVDLWSKRGEAGW